VLTDLFAPGAALEHIELGRWAHAVVVCPATANTLNRCAAGLADDFPGALFLAHDWSKPWLFAPAMNPAMWSHPATVAAVGKLRSWGARFIPIGRGRTACGELGEGRMAEPAEILPWIEAALAQPRRPLRVLITSGPTAEPIDGVRVLTNFSTGTTGAGIAEHFSRAGHRVVLLRGRGSATSAAPCEQEEFVSVADLDLALKRRLTGADFDAVIHAAAVGDFTVDSIEINGRLQEPDGSKLDSDSAPIVRLRSAPKLIESFRRRSRNQAIKVVAFKLTIAAAAKEAKAATAALAARAEADWVVHNDLTSRVSTEKFPSEIYAADGSIAGTCETRSDLSARLEQLLSGAHAATGPRST
jgi:phosphopantothenoylcysteine decarboxylase/phosphopantothenate--cysteine ligase